MDIKLDLHIHSERSPDGCMSVAEIVSLAKSQGLHGAAICDHDAVLPETPELGDFLVIPGVEVSTQLGHLLGLFVSAPVETRDFFEAVELIHAQGGLAVLAHPFEHSRDEARLTPALPLLDGVEVQNSRAERKIREANALARTFAEKHGLRQFGGSDAHCPAEVGNSFTVVDAPELTPDAVKAALLAGNAAAQGRASRAWYAARSQLTKRRKTGAGPAAYAKWAAFAAKCCIQDIFRRGD